MFTGGHYIVDYSAEYIKTGKSTTGRRTGRSANHFRRFRPLLQPDKLKNYVWNFGGKVTITYTNEINMKVLLYLALCPIIVNISGCYYTVNFDRSKYLELKKMGMRQYNLI